MQLQFKFYTNSYAAVFEYLKTKNSINAICDTGATRTTIDIASLSILTGFECEKIENLALDWYNKYIKYSPSNDFDESILRKSIERSNTITTASGNKNKLIPIKLSNVMLCGQHFSSFYTKLNISNNSWKYADNNSADMNGYILIGLDIIRASKCSYIEKDKIVINEIDINEYVKMATTNQGTILNLYESLVE